MASSTAPAIRRIERCNFSRSRSMCFDTDPAPPRHRPGRGRSVKMVLAIMTWTPPPDPANPPGIRSRGRPMALPTGTPVPAVADFLRDLGRSRAVEPARVEELFADAPPDRKRRPDAFAEHLVGLGELTKFQADKLLRGHWRGLALGPYRLLCPLGRG